MHGKYHVPGNSAGDPFGMVSSRDPFKWLESWPPRIVDERSRIESPVTVTTRILIFLVGDPNLNLRVSLLSWEGGTSQCIARMLFKTLEAWATVARCLIDSWPPWDGRNNGSHESQAWHIFMWINSLEKIWNLSGIRKKQAKPNQLCTCFFWRKKKYPSQNSNPSPEKWVLLHDPSPNRLRA